MPKILTKKQADKITPFVGHRQRSHEILKSLKVGQSARYSPEELSDYRSTSNAQSTVHMSAKNYNIKVSTRAFDVDDGVGLLVTRVE